MSDDLAAVIRLVFIFLKEIDSTGECDLIDILFYFILRHAYTVVHDFNSMFILVDDDSDRKFFIFGKAGFTYGYQLFQFNERIVGV